MKTIKNYVKEVYSKVVTTAKSEASCCSTTCCKAGFNDDYKDVTGYHPEADYGLGCGMPTAFAKLKPGQTVLDLGSGAGNDCFVARAEIGSQGKVYGLDFSAAMIAKAKENTLALGYSNIEFILGDIEEIPFENSSIDVVLSNCVLNLVPDKRKVFTSIHRILRAGGHFSISDVVTTVDMPLDMRSDSDLFSSCVAGAIPKENYIQKIRNAGFQNLTIVKERELPFLDYVDVNYQVPQRFKILSLTIYAEKTVSDH